MLALFVIDLIIPDPIPLIDEILFGSLTVLLASLRKRTPAEGEKPPEKNVTP